MTKARTSSTTKLPFHVDLTSNVAYYTSFNLSISRNELRSQSTFHPYRIAEAAAAAALEDKEKAHSDEEDDELVSCEVSIGDMIAVHMDAEEGNDFCRRDADGKQIKAKMNSEQSDFVHEILRQSSRCDYNAGFQYIPFTDVWNACEVVSIYRCLSKEEALDLHKAMGKKNGRKKQKVKKKRGSKSKSSKIARAEVMMEVRWFYKENEVLVTSRRKRKRHDMRNDDNQISSGRNENKETNKSLISTDCNSDMVELDKLFETDLVNECSSLSILGLVDLHPGRKIGQAQVKELVCKWEDEKFTKLPCIPFHCSKMWSISQRCFLPVGSLESRVERGRMHSNFLRENNDIRKALEDTLRTQSNLSPVFRSQNFDHECDRAISLFSLSKASEDATISKLQCREKEFDRIKKFISSSSSEGEPSMFIAGPPGVGKTATVMSVVAHLKNQSSRGKATRFEFIAINALELRSPMEAYTQIWNSITGMERPPEIAAKNLDAFFGNKDSITELGNDKVFLYENIDLLKTKVYVLMVDEIDYLVTEKQDVLYDIFSWPNRKGVQGSICVIGISNTINLPENILLPKVQSRLGSLRIIFQSYNTEQIRKILESKLNSDTSLKRLFHDDAINLAARKTAVSKGDIRRAFQLCKTAIEIVADEDRTERQVLATDVMEASRKLQGSLPLRGVSTCTAFEALVMVSLSSLRRQSGRSFCSIHGLLRKMNGIASASGNMVYMPCPTYGETTGLLTRMSESRLVVVETPKSFNNIQSILAGNIVGTLHPIIKLNLDDYDLRRCLEISVFSDISKRHLTDEF